MHILLMLGRCPRIVFGHIVMICLNTGSALNQIEGIRIVFKSVSVRHACENDLDTVSSFSRQFIVSNIGVPEQNRTDPQCRVKACRLGIDLQGH